MKRLWVASVLGMTVWTGLCHWWMVNEFHRTQEESRMFLDTQLEENDSRMQGYLELLTKTAKASSQTLTSNPPAKHYLWHWFQVK